MNRQLLTFYDEVFECGFRVYLNFKEQEFIDDIRRRNIGEAVTIDLLTGADGVCVTSAAGGIAIWVRDADFSKPKAMGVLVHECMHATLNRLVDDCGVDVGEQESLAFYIGFLVRTILKKAKGKKQKAC